MLTLVSKPLRRLMNTKLTTTFLAAFLITSVSLSAGQPPIKAKNGSPEFERMKSLVGKWAGKMDMGKGPVDFNVSFRLIAGGSVLEERVNAGTPMEMTTMYYDQKGKLALTHYCSLGNRPTMMLKSSDKKSIEFDFDAACGINPKKESHMHALKIVFDSKNKITTNWKAIMQGKDMPEQAIVLKRVK